MSQFQLLTRPDSQPKAKKGQKKRVLTFVLHLAPSWLSGNNVCAGASEGCIEACINLSGHGQFARAQSARVRKTRWFFENRAAFMAALVSDITKAIAYARKKRMRVAFRLNATSDIPWHRIPVAGAANLMELFPTAQFYDYTKVAQRFGHDLPANYHLTFSLAEHNTDQARKVLALGGNVAAVFRTRAMVEQLLAGERFLDFPVCDGDDTDLRFLDPANHIVALYAKGKGKRDTTGFVKDLAA